MPSVSESCSRIVECHRDRRITGRKHRDTTSFQVKTEDTSSTQSIQVCLEVGHRAVMRSRPTVEGFTHDWVVYVRSTSSSNIDEFVDKVEFHLHKSFPKSRRIVRESPFQVSETGYGGFTLPIDVYFSNNEESKKIRFDYELFLGTDRQVSHSRLETITFSNPSKVFAERLLKGGALVVESGVSTESRSSKPDIPVVKLQRLQKDICNPVAQSRTIHRDRIDHQVAPRPVSRPLHVERVGLHCRVALSDTANQSGTSSLRASTADSGSVDIQRSARVKIERELYERRQQQSRIEAVNFNWNRFHAATSCTPSPSTSSASKHVTFSIDNDVLSTSGASMSPSFTSNNRNSVGVQRVAVKARGRPSKKGAKMATVVTSSDGQKQQRGRGRPRRVALGDHVQLPVQVVVEKPIEVVSRPPSRCGVGDKENAMPPRRNVADDVIDIASRDAVVTSSTTRNDVTVPVRGSEPQHVSRDSDGLQRHLHSHQLQQQQQQQSSRRVMDESVTIVSHQLAPSVRDSTRHQPSVNDQPTTGKPEVDDALCRQRPVDIDVAQSGRVHQQPTANCVNSNSGVAVHAVDHQQPVSRDVILTCRPPTVVVERQTQNAASGEQVKSSQLDVNNNNNDDDDEIDSYFDRLSLPDSIGQPMLSSTPIKLPVGPATGVTSSVAGAAAKPRGARMRYKPPTRLPPLDDEDGERMTRDELARLIAATSRPTRGPLICQATTLCQPSPTSVLLPSGVKRPVIVSTTQTVSPPSPPTVVTSSATSQYADPTHRPQFDTVQPPSGVRDVIQHGGQLSHVTTDDRVTSSRPALKRCHDDDVTSSSPIKRRAVELQHDKMASTQQPEVAALKPAPRVAALQPEMPSRRAQNGVRVDELLRLQRALFTLSDVSVLRQVVQIIGETGRFLVNDATFDFDLCHLDAATVTRLMECIDNNSHH